MSSTMMCGALLMAGLVHQSHAGDCEIDFQMANFDLSDLTRHGNPAYYQVTDGDIPCTKAIEKNYTYSFNVCGNVGNIDNFCQANAAAVQWDTVGDNSDCAVAGRYDTSRTNWELLNPSDPSKGVAITYTGDYCGHDRFGNDISGTQQLPRTFRLEFACTDNANPVPLVANEIEHCHYVVEMPSFYGCPTSCARANGHLCNGKGHCEFDTGKKVSHCFCNQGWDGDACETETRKGAYSTTSIALLSILLVVSLGLVGVIAYLVKQVRAYRQDAANYMSLQSSDMGDMDTGV